MQPSFLLHDSPIFLGSLADAFPTWFAQQAYSQVFVIADEHTHVLCLPVFLNSAQLPVAPQTVVIPSGENQKNLATCTTIWQSMLDANLDRKALVVNLGGGVIGDMGGFCAATWKRGVDFVHIPTTLLSMTDAAIGGKLGVDFQNLKNIIGVFRQPAAVFVDPTFLSTLPDRELRSGCAEVIKHALIGDPALWRQIQQNGFPTSAGGWQEMLQASIAVKVRVVQEDPQEKGLRMLLNFGHTIGHAIESYFLETNDPLTHGEAIAIGMYCETVEKTAKTAIYEVISTLYAHRNIPETAFPALWSLMQQDKKNASGKVRVALPDALPYSMKIEEPAQAEIMRSLEAYNDLG